jgi:hypothetical protein
VWILLDKFLKPQRIGEMNLFNSVFSGRTGQGEMFTASPYKKEFFTIYNNLLPETQKALLRLARDLLVIQKK